MVETQDLMLNEKVTFIYILLQTCKPICMFRDANTWDKITRENKGERKFRTVFNSLKWGLSNCRRETGDLSIFDLLLIMYLKFYFLATKYQKKIF